MLILSDRQEQAVNRYNAIWEIVKGDRFAADMVRGVYNAAESYIGVTITYETECSISQKKDSENYDFRDDRQKREEISQIDGRKRISHEALQSNLLSTNKHLFKQFPGKIPIGGLYTLPPESIRDRNAVGDWAGHLIFGFKKMPRKDNLEERLQ